MPTLRLRFIISRSFAYYFFSTQKRELGKCVTKCAPIHKTNNLTGKLILVFDFTASLGVQFISIHSGWAFPKVLLVMTFSSVSIVEKMIKRNTPVNASVEWFLKKFCLKWKRTS